MNFWASWRAPCRDEAPRLNATYPVLNPFDAVFGVIAWNDIDADARAFMRHYAPPYEWACDANGAGAVDYGITGAPETFIIQHQGRLAKQWAGPITAPLLVAMVDPLLR